MFGNTISCVEQKIRLSCKIFFISILFSFMKKIFSFVVWILLFSNTILTWAVDLDHHWGITASVANKFQDTITIIQIKKASETYINTFSWAFENWTGNSPKLNWDPVPYYADDETMPVALEWKISCSSTEDCGRIITSVDKKIPIVMEATTEGRANYETLGNNRENMKNRFYYFSPFEQYVDTDSDSNENVVSLSPWENMTKSVKRNQIKEKQGKNKEAKKQRKQYVEENSFWYSQTGATVVNVPNTNNGATCTSPIPCYTQFTNTYTNWTCAVWCWPTALTQILAYHDRRGTFPNLFPNIIASPTTIDQTIANIIRTYMGTVCSWVEWATTFANEGNGLKYARDRGYINTILPSLITSNLFYNIRLQVNQGRPLIINASSSSVWHIFVAYGWNTDTVWMNQIHVNYWWGSGTPDAWITETNIPALPWMRVLSILPVVITP